MDTPSIELKAPADAEEWRQAQAILREYGQSLGVDLSFQRFDEEVDQLAERYTQPGTFFLLAWVGGAVAGCGALAPLPPSCSHNAIEMRRLYVRPVFRRFGLGRALAQALMGRAVITGHDEMLIDTLSDMAAARQLYESLGFEPTDPYYFNPLPGAHYFHADLRAEATPRWL
jgi:putative acetyltransferase